MDNQINEAEKSSAKSSVAPGYVSRVNAVINIFSKALNLFVYSSTSPRKMLDGGARKESPIGFFEQSKPVRGMVDGGVPKGFPTNLYNSELTASGDLKQYIDGGTSDLYGALPENSASALPQSKVDILRDFNNFKGMSSTSFVDMPMPILNTDLTIKPRHNVEAEISKNEPSTKPRRKAEAAGPSGPEL
jgi:hypothetical protein